MTDKINCFTIALEEDMRVDDAESLKNAILMLKGVIGVQGNVISSSDYVAEMRAKIEVQKKVYDVLKSL